MSSLEQEGKERVVVGFGFCGCFLLNWEATGKRQAL